MSWRQTPKQGQTEATEAMEPFPERIADRIDAAAGIRQLLKLTGVQSVKAASDWESEAAKRDLDAVHHDMSDECGMGSKEKSDDDAMRDVLSAGPITINQSSEAQKRNGVAGKIASLGLAALGLGAAVSLPILAWNMTRPDESPDQAQVELGARFVPLPQPRD